MISKLHLEMHRKKDILGTTEKDIQGAQFNMLKILNLIEKESHFR